jgi:hypothetical protein
MKKNSETRRRSPALSNNNDDDCGGGCEGFGFVWKVVEGGCRGADKTEIFESVKKDARKDAEQNAKEDCEEDAECVCRGKHTEIASGRVTVKGIEGKTCVFYAIFYYKGKCVLSI